jgi:hypothetical protein
VIQDFSPSGVYYLEVPCGENQRAALDYRYHYRSPRMMGMDADYSVSRAFGARGWPTFVVIDPDGIIRFQGFDSNRDLREVRRCLTDLLKGKPADTKAAVMSQGVAYLPDFQAARLAPRDRSPRLCFDAAGNPLVVLYSNRTGTNSGYLRRYDQQGRPLGDVRLSPADMESYAPDCVMDSAGDLWVAWCARAGERYDIFVQCRRAGKEPVTERLSRSDDDAIAPRIAAGPGGALMVTYYEWALMRGVSRDRNIFARRYDPARQAWDMAQEISPHVPEVEDHTDPDVVIDSQGNHWVVWSFDYHSQLYKKPVEAEQPTIFAARATSNSVSPPMLVGATGKLRYAIDLFPSAALDTQGSLWCAWDCSEPRRCIRLAHLDAAADNTFKAVSALGEEGETCSTPELSPAGQDRLLLTWSQHRRGEPWCGKLVLLQQGRTLAQTMLNESGDVLFPQAQVSPNGHYWVAYERAGPKGSGIVLRDVTRELDAAPR